MNKLIIAAAVGVIGVLFFTACHKDVNTPAGSPAAGTSSAPESVAAPKGDSPVGKLLYAGEKLMYRRADAMVFTMEGAPDYIREHGWDREHGGPIDLNRVYNINNGVDLEAFDRNIREFPYPDPDLDDPDSFCVVYTGAVRRANNLGLMLDAMEYLRDIPNLKLLKPDL